MTNPRRGEVYFVAIHENEIVGHEQAKSRRYVIVSSDRVNSRVPVVIGVPISLKTEKQSQFSVLIPQTEIIEDVGTRGCKEGVALAHQIRVLDLARLGVPPERVARLTPAGMARVEAAIAFALEIRS